MDDHPAGSGSQKSPEQLPVPHPACDAGAFESLVGRHEDKLFAFIARFTGDRRLAEDVFQQTFITAAESAACLDDEISFSNRLYRIARDASMNALRHCRREHAVHVDGMGRDERSERIRLALASLPDPQREAFLLREEAELDFERIGVIMNCGGKTARSRFRLAAARLREFFDGDEQDKR